MTLAKPKAILFDWDNTLVDTFPIIFQGLHDTFVAMGMEPWTMEDVLQNRDGIHHSLRDSFPRIFGERWEEAKEAYFESFLANHLEKIVMLPGAHETLDVLLDKDIFVGVVSNKTGVHLRTEIKHMGWEHCFKVVVGALDAEKDKPHPDPVYMALESSGIHPDEEVYLIGDSATDVECALNAGIRPVIFGGHIFGQVSAEKEKAYRKFYQVSDHKELQEIVKDY